MCHNLHDSVDQLTISNIESYLGEVPIKSKLYGIRTRLVTVMPIKLAFERNCGNSITKGED